MVTGECPSYISALLTLLDRIEIETEEAGTRRLCGLRFQIAKDHGFTVEFGGPASGTIQ